MSNNIDFHSLDPQFKIMMLENIVNRGSFVRKIISGMCGEIYIFDQGINAFSRYLCAKLPKPLNGCTQIETAQRFVCEMEKQMSFYHHMFVHRAFDFKEVMNTPVALFRYWGSDLSELIKEKNSSYIEKLSIMVYICEGLMHCQKKGLVSHQDLKPQNIFIRNMKPSFPGLPNLDIYKFPMIADFGLSNAFMDSNVYEGSRPYMAPEQWEKDTLSPATDIFALGVIFQQLLTDGYHPAGILLHEHWPDPLLGNSKKWTKEDAWRKWIKNGANITNINNQVPHKLVLLIQSMLSVAPNDRPEINDVKLDILSLIKNFCPDSYEQINGLIKYYNDQTQNEALDVINPYLSKRWEWFKSKFRTSQ